MGSGKQLTEREKGQISAFNGTGLSIREIARKINRSKTVVLNFLKKGEDYGNYKNCGRKPKLTPRDKRRIVSHASNTMTSANEIIRTCQLNVSRFTVYRALQQSGVIKRQRMKAAPNLKEHHKTARLDFGRKNMATDWTKVGLFYFTYFVLLIFCCYNKYFCR